MRLSYCRSILLVFPAALPTTASRWLKKETELPFRCVDKGIVVDNSGYDDDTVVCDQESGFYDLQYLDPNKAPLRCELWDPTQTNLESVHPWAICVQWHMLYGAPKTTYAPSVPPETETDPPTLAPTNIATIATSSPPTNAPTHSPTSPAVALPAPPTESGTTNTVPETNPPTTSPLVVIDSIQLEPFALRLVVPTTTRRLEQIAAPFDSNLLLDITQIHIHNYLESELNRNVERVQLEYVEPSQVASLQGSTVVLAHFAGSVLMGGAPSAKTVTALAMQSFEGHALWEYFFQLRGSDDTALSKTQEVTLVDVPTTTSTSSEDKMSGLVIGIVTVTATLTAGIMVYMFVWAKRDDANGKDNNCDTPDTNASSQFFPELESDNSAMLGSIGRSNNYARNDDTHSVNSGHISLVSSTLHSILERSLEDEEDAEEAPRDSVQWDTMSVIEVHQDIVDIIPNSVHVDESVDLQTIDYLHEGRIERIMRVDEPSVHTTDEGTEVVSTGKQPVASQHKKKPFAKRWMKWIAPKGSITNESSEWIV